MRKERYWTCSHCPWWAHRKKAETGRRCPKCSRPMAKARKYPEHLARRYNTIVRRRNKKARQDNARAWRRFQVLRGAGIRAGGRKVRISLRTRRAYEAVFTARDKWSRGRAAERLFKAFGRDIGAKEGVTLNWVDTAVPGVGTLGVYHHLGAITLAHNQPQDEMRDTICHEMAHWADRTAGISHDRTYGSHTRLFYVRVGWLRSQIER